MELSTLETSCGSVLDEGVDSSGLTSLHPVHDQRAASDIAFGPPIEEMSLQTLTKQLLPKREHVNSSKESSSKGAASMCLSFLKKLWAVVENDRFQSIWWGDNGKCVVIHEELFEEEILARRGHLRIFESESMKNFTHHLQLYGFTRRLMDFPKSGSCSDLQAEEMAREFHFYYNPDFQRHFPHELLKYKQSFGLKNPTPARSSLDTGKKRSPKRKHEAELMWEATSEEESGPSTAGSQEGWAQLCTWEGPTCQVMCQGSTPSQMGLCTCPPRCSDRSWPCGSRRLGAAPSSGLLPQCSSPSRAGVLSAASAATSLGPAMPHSHLPLGLDLPPLQLHWQPLLSLPRPPQGQTSP